MESCVFCNIVEKKIPAEIIYEDEATVAFLDIHPTNAGHTILIPKRHYESVLTIPGEIMAQLGERLPQLARAVVAGAKADGCNTTINNGSAAGQIIFHLHVHIIPRFASDGYTLWGHRDYLPGEAAAIAESIRQSIGS